MYSKMCGILEGWLHNSRHSFGASFFDTPIFPLFGSFFAPTQIPCATFLWLFQPWDSEGAGRGAPRLPLATHKDRLDTLTAGWWFSATAVC